MSGPLDPADLNLDRLISSELVRTQRLWPAPDGVYTTSVALTREVLEAAFDEVRYGPLPTVDDILNDGLEPRMYPAVDFQPEPMPIVPAGGTLSFNWVRRDHRTDAMMYAWHAQAVVAPSQKITDIIDS